MKISPKVQVLPLLFLAVLPAEAQGFAELERINQIRLDYNQQGMLILGAWALLNLLLGSIGSFRTRGQSQAFHQMNAFWNVVNLGIAVFGFWQATQVAAMNFLEGLVAQQQIEKVLLVNVALDFGYLLLGLYLIERGRRLEKDRWIGFGKSILLQGAFLLLFDAILYGFQQQLGIDLVELGKGMAALPVK